MILLTTLRGDRFGLNPDLVEEIRANGTNCVVTMITGRSFTAAEDVDTVHRILNEQRVEVLRQASRPSGPSDSGNPNDPYDPCDPSEESGGDRSTGIGERPRHGEHPDYLTPVPSKEQ